MEIQSFSDTGHSRRGMQAQKGKMKEFSTRSIEEDYGQARITHGDTNPKDSSPIKRLEANVDYENLRVGLHEAFVQLRANRDIKKFLADLKQEKIMALFSRARAIEPFQDAEEIAFARYFEVFSLEQLSDLLSSITEAIQQPPPDVTLNTSQVLFLWEIQSILQSEIDRVISKGSEEIPKSLREACLVFWDSISNDYTALGEIDLAHLESQNRDELLNLKNLLFLIRRVLEQSSLQDQIDTLLVAVSFDLCKRFSKYADYQRFSTAVFEKYHFDILFPCRLVGDDETVPQLEVDLIISTICCHPLLSPSGDLHLKELFHHKSDSELALIKEFYGKTTTSFDDWRNDHFRAVAKTVCRHVKKLLELRVTLSNCSGQYAEAINLFLNGQDSLRDRIKKHLWDLPDLLSAERTLKFYIESDPRFEAIRHYILAKSNLIPIEENSNFARQHAANEILPGEILFLQAMHALSIYLSQPENNRTFKSAIKILRARTIWSISAHKRLNTLSRMCDFLSTRA